MRAAARLCVLRRVAATATTAGNCMTRRCCESGDGVLRRAAWRATWALRRRTGGVRQRQNGGGDGWRNCGCANGKRQMRRAAAAAGVWRRRYAALRVYGMQWRRRALQRRRRRRNGVDGRRRGARRRRWCWKADERCRRWRWTVRWSTAYGRRWWLAEAARRHGSVRRWPRGGRADGPAGAVGAAAACGRRGAGGDGRRAAAWCEAGGCSGTAHDGPVRHGESRRAAGPTKRRSGAAAMRAADGARPVRARWSTTGGGGGGRRMACGGVSGGNGSGVAGEQRRSGGAAAALRNRRRQMRSCEYGCGAATWRRVREMRRERQCASANARCYCAQRCEYGAVLCAAQRNARLAATAAAKACGYGGRAAAGEP